MEKVRATSNYGQRSRGRWISTNPSASNQQFGLSTLHTRGQSPKATALQNAYMAVFVDHGDGFSKEVWSDKNESPNYGQEAVHGFSLKQK
jgi:hypothetical protein